MNREELAQLLGCANERKEGDLSIGVGASDDATRAAAKHELERVRLGDIRGCDLVEDRLTEQLRELFEEDPAAQEAFEPMRGQTVGEIRDALGDAPDPRFVRQLGDGMTSEMIAAVAKVMTDDQLRRVCAATANPLSGPGSVGSQQCLGARIQPNSPTDDPTEILYSIFEGLSYGCGDVIIGVNPANDEIDQVMELENLLADAVTRLELPTRWSVLSDMKKQREALSRGAKVDVGFQSLAGTSKALRGMLACDVDELLDLCQSFDGLYFETGQGSEFTNGADEGIDMVTLEARTYGLARWVRQKTNQWTIVNDVAGFIGPEVFRTGKQLIRACLEDLFMGKLHGLAMGLDICSTFHMGIAPGELDEINESVAPAGPAYLMAVAGKADPMLGYLTTDFRSHPRLRSLTGKSVAHRWRQRLCQLGVMRASGELTQEAGNLAPLAAAFGEDGPSVPKTVKRLQDRGLDIGHGYERDFRPPGHVEERLDRVFQHARRALYREVAPAAIEGASPAFLCIATTSHDRDDYIARPETGERISRTDMPRIRTMYGATERPTVQIVVSDGLNADAVNENLDPLLAPLRGRLHQAGINCGKDLYVRNGRVRAGYHIGEILDVPVVVHLIGERPGTGTNNLSAYITLGRTPEGVSRWAGIEHADTTALCSINRRVGVKPEDAAARIADWVALMLKHQRSGVALIPYLSRQDSQNGKA